METAIVNMPAGIGEPFFGSIESVLAHLLFSIPAVKGVEFGLGFGFANLFGSQANDPFVMKDKVCTTTNHNWWYQRRYQQWYAHYDKNGSKTYPLPFTNHSRQLTFKKEKMHSCKFMVVMTLLSFTVQELW